MRADVHNFSSDLWPIEALKNSSIDNAQAKARAAEEAYGLARRRLLAIHWQRLLKTFALDYPMLQPFARQLMPDEFPRHVSSGCMAAEIVVLLPGHAPLVTSYEWNAGERAVWRQPLCFWATLKLHERPDGAESSLHHFVTTDLGEALVAAEAAYDAACRYGLRKQSLRKGEGD